MEASKRARLGSATSPALFSGGVLGVGLLAWMIVTLFAPGFGSMAAVFGSPLIAFCIILRLLTLPANRRRAQAGPAASVLAADQALRDRVIARDGDCCHACGARAPLSLQLVLPVGAKTHDLDHRFVALCSACQQRRSRRSRGSLPLHPQAGDGSQEATPVP